jgi:ParB/RepB/Spo0J family partition protein
MQFDTASNAAARRQKVPAHVSTTRTLAAHPLADIFPLIEGAEFDALVESIKRDGQLEPIMVHRQQILDGRNRYRACLKAGVAPRFEEFESDDPAVQARWVAAKNLSRRHLSESQRAMIAAELTAHHGVTVSAAAQQLNVSEKSIKRARFVATKAIDNVVQLVRSGEMSVHKAYEQTQQRTKAPGAQVGALTRGLDMIEKALSSGEAIAEDVRRRAAGIGARLVAMAGRSAVA